jgi:hypothetical protein
MAAISASINRGLDGFRIDSYTVGVLAPGANDIEFRFNTTDALGQPVTRKDVITALEGFIRVVEADSFFITNAAI